ncbi:MAG: leucine-rich repeat domain-containing protein [Myxococcales bacterium]|nr:leucine-rich repeat domain-containing protein [Myxococcales bacterium]
MILTYRQVTEEEALEHYKLDTLQNWEQTLILFEGDTTIQGDLEGGFAESLEGIEGDKSRAVLIFAGNLTVQGKLSSMDYWPNILVLGDVYADALFSGDSEIYITGDAHIKHLVYGNYNDGMLTIDGTTHTRYVICSDHSMEMTAPGAVFINAYSDYDDFFDYDYYASDLEHVLTNKVCRGEDIDVDAFLESLKKKRPVFRKGVKPARQLIQERLDALVKQGKPPEHLDLAEEKLPRFPMQVLKLPSLRSLSLKKVSLSEIPEEIEQLQDLEELDLSGCGLEQLPESLGKLPSLRVLKLVDNPNLTLPEGLKHLKHLKYLSYSPKEFQLPAWLDQLTELEELDLSSWGNEAFDFPEVITQMTSLKRLSLQRIAFHEIPDSLTQLTSLEEIKLDGGPLCFLKKLPDFSKMPNLRVIHADGLRTNSTRPNPDKALIKSFFTAPALEELYIDRHHGSSEDFAGIGQAKHLKSLDLSFNDLTSLPEEIYTLPLESLNLQYNKLDKQERRKITEHFPKTKLNLRNNPNGPETNEDIKHINQQIAAGNKQSNRQDYAQAIDTYEKVLQILQSGAVSSAYNELYARYRLMWLYSQLGYQWSGITDAELYKRLCAEEGRRCLALVPTHNIWHFTDEGAFHEEVVRFASNAVAWYKYEQAKDQAALEQALSTIERALPFAKEAAFFYVQDTYVRILLALDRQDEAYQCVYKILAQEPKFKDFQDIKKSSPYKSWLRKRNKGK